jgi:hypothetical protein
MLLNCPPFPRNYIANMSARHWETARNLLMGDTARCHLSDEIYVSLDEYGSGSSTRIDAVKYWFNVVWIDATPDAAEMVKFFIARHRSVFLFVIQDVNQNSCVVYRGFRVTCTGHR